MRGIDRWSDWMTRAEFVALLATMEEGWNTSNAALVAGCFTEEVIYTDPLRYRFTHRADLLPFFAVPEGESQTVVWHAMVFDEAEQSGAAEYSYTGSFTYHGLALVRVRDGLISEWREYQHTSGTPWEAFIAGKDIPTST
jgi:hypothetical protein